MIFENTKPVEVYQKNRESCELDEVGNHMCSPEKKVRLIVQNAKEMMLSFGEWVGGNGVGSTFLSERKHIHCQDIKLTVDTHLCDVVPTLGLPDLDGAFAGGAAFLHAD